MLDSLEYGFDVEVVGAVGVDVLESGGAYVGQVLVFDGVAFVLVGGDGEPTRRRCHHELVFDIGPPLWERIKTEAEQAGADWGGSKLDCSVAAWSRSPQPKRSTATGY